MRNILITGGFGLRSSVILDSHGSRLLMGMHSLTLRLVQLSILASIILLMTTTGWCHASTGSSTNESASIAEKWGIEILGVRRSAAGHMLDFRYRVVDSQKATPLFTRQTKPYLIDEASGKVLTVPNMAKVGPLRTSNPPLSGRTYWMFFGNPGVVKAGSKVSVVIGDFKVKELTVQ